MSSLTQNLVDMLTKFQVKERERRGREGWGEAESRDALTDGEMV